MASALRVAVHTIGGTCQEFDVEADVPYLDLVQQVAGLEGLPPDHVQLVVGDRALDSSIDERPFQGRVPSEAPIQVTAVLRWGVLADADPHTWTKRVRALDEFVGFSRRGDQRVLGVVHHLLEDGHPGVRCAAVAALAKVAHQGDEQALLAVHRQLKEDSSPSVHAAVLRVLGVLAPPGDAASLEAAFTQLVHPVPEARVAALQALAALAPRGDAAILAGVAQRLADRDSQVAEVARMALPLLASDGGTDLAAAVDEPASGRRTASEGGEPPPVGAVPHVPEPLSWVRC